jgi:hypothetical protein
LILLPNIVVNVETLTLFFPGVSALIENLVEGMLMLKEVNT